MKLHASTLAFVAALTLVWQAEARSALWEENFDSLILGPSVNERLSTIPSFDLSTVVADDPDYSPIPNAIADFDPVAPGRQPVPAGWAIDNYFNAFGNIDFAYNPFAQGDPAVLDIEEGIVPPVGTVIGNAGLRNQGDFFDGVDEWEGWNVASKDFWIEVAEDQERSQFTLGTGNVAIADPDEYDDLNAGRGDGYFNSGLSTPMIPIPAGNNDLQLRFDSSFRPEAFDDGHNAGSSLLGESLNNQTAVVYATYDGPNGGTQVVPGTLMDSDGGNGMIGDPDYRPVSPTYRDESLTLNESFAVLLPSIPADATNVQLTFGMLNGGNDWWWAIDNIEVLGDFSGSFFTEDFEGATLVDSINEQIADVPEFAHLTTANDTPDTMPRPNSFTNVPPAGWNVNNSNMPFAPADDNIGVYEFEGWNFMDLDFWTFADRQQRELFEKASGILAVADGDEWDDLGDPTGRTDPPAGGLMNTLLESPEIDITGVAEGQLMLSFDFSWRDEDDNTAVVTVDYGAGPVEVLRWESDETSPFFFDDQPNGSVMIPLDNPLGATTAKIAFQYIGGNDWWWAIDNIAVSAVPEPTSVALVALSLVSLGVVRQRK